MWRNVGRKVLAGILSALMVLSGMPLTQVAVALAAEQPSAPLRIRVEEPEAVKHTVAFVDGITNETISTQEVQEGESATAPAAPTHEGYAFKEWDVSFHNITADLTVTALYDRYYTVTFTDWDGKTLSGQQVLSGQDAWIPAAPVRDGYAFTAWRGLSGESVSLQNITADLTVVASYTLLEKYEITVHFYMNNTGEKCADPLSFFVPKGASFQKEIPAPQVAGYVPGVESLSINLENVTQDYVYEIVYSPDGETAYQVVYKFQNIDNDEYVSDPQYPALHLTGTTGDLVKAPALATTPVGFELASVGEAAIAADGSTVLEVCYDRLVYTLSFDTQGGTFIPGIVGRYGMPLAKPESPERVGYRFWDWSNQSDGKGTWTFPKTLTQNETAYAIWDAMDVDYTLVYWLEKPNFSGDPGNPVSDPTARDNYSFFSSSAAKGKAGSEVTKSVRGTDSAFNITNGVGKTANYASFVSADTVTLEGDGTSVVNVYFKRNVYTITFDLNDSLASIVTGGKTYRDRDYSISAKYEQSLGGLWPVDGSAPTTTKTNGKKAIKFNGWKPASAVSSSTWVTKKVSMASDMLPQSGTSYTVTALWETNSNVYQANYYFEKLKHQSATSANSINYDNKTYVLDEEYSQSYNFTSGNLSAKGIVGMTSVDVDEKTIDGVKTFRLKYNRNKYTLSFNTMGGASVPAVRNVAYGERISDLDPGWNASKNTKMVNGVVYYFAGWYKDAEYKTPFQFGTADSSATMPASNLTLFAKWSTRAYDVTFSYGVTGMEDLTVQVSGGQSIPSQKPTAEGYEFVGWYRDPEFKQLYSMGDVIMADLKLYARWTAGQTSYTVRYKGAAIPDKVLTGKVGTTVTEEAVRVDNLLPNYFSQSIVLGGNALNNIITFSYVPLVETRYSVRYVDFADRTTELAPSVEKSTTAVQVVEIFRQINGYVPTQYQITRLLSSNAQENIITFYYKANSPRGYAEKHYLQSIQDESKYAVDKTLSLDAPLGASVASKPLSYPGFTFVKAKSSPAQIIDGEAEVVVHTYYDRNSYLYTIRHYLQNAVGDGYTQVMADMVTRDGKFGAPLEYLDSQKTYEHAVFSHVETAGQQTIPANNNLSIKFYYDRELVNITFNKGDYGKLAGQDKKGNVEVPTRYGALPAAPEVTPNTGYAFIGWSPVVEEATQSVTYTAQYSKDMRAYTVRYLLAGTEIAVAAPAQGAEKVGETVTAQAPALEGYALSSASGSASVVISKDSENVITFYYQKLLTLRPEDRSFLYTPGIAQGADGVRVTAEGNALITAGGLQEGHTLSTLVIASNPKQEKVGNYPGNLTASAPVILADGKDVTASYRITLETGNLYITPNESMRATAKPLSALYDGAAHNITVTSNIPDAKIEYRLKDTGDYSANFGMTDAGEYTVEYRVTQPNYQMVTGSAKLTILKRPITLTVESGEYPYDGRSHTLSTRSTPQSGDAGLASGDRLSVSLLNAPKTDAGVYAVDFNKTTTVIRDAQGLDVTGNYRVAYEAGTMTIKPRQATIVVDSKTKGYLAADPEWTGSVLGLIAQGDLGEIAYGRAAADLNKENVGDDITLTAQYRSNPNYEVQTVTGKLSITPATFEVKVEAVTEIYDGTEKNVAIEIPSDAAISYTNNGQTEAGTYEVGYEIIRPNYETITGSVTLTIEKASVTITPADSGKVYGAEEPALTATDDKPESGAALNYTLARGAGEDVGTYPITVTPGENPNYNVTTGEAAFEITSGTFEVEARDVTATYDGTVKSVDIAIPEDAAITYTNNDKTEAGEYKVGYQITRPNYQPVQGSVTLTVNPAQVTITPANQTKVFGQPDPTLTATDNKPVSGAALNYTLARARGENVGEYAITVKPGRNPNYIVDTGEAALNITPAAFEVEADNVTATYDGTEKNVNIAVPSGATVTYTNNGQTEAGAYEVGYEITRPNYETVTGIVTLTVEKANVTITPANSGKVYGAEEPALTATDDKPENGAALNYTLARGEGEDTGTYPITVTLGENPNYNVTMGEAAFDITAAAYEVEAGDMTATYDGTEKNVSIVIPEDATVTYTNNGQTEAGAYEVGYEITRPNYQPITGTVTLTVEKANVTITPANSGKVYGAEEPALTATNDKPESGAALNYTLARGEGEDAGTYPITVTLGENPNYNVTTGEAAFEITAAAYEVEANDMTATYDGTEKNVSIAIPEDATVTYTNNGQTEAGEYEVGYEITRPNYETLTGTVILTIEKANVTITPANSGKAYGTKEPSLTAADDKPESGAALNYTLARDAGEDVGTYPITVTLGENPNYNVATGEAAFEITPAVFEVKAADMTATYDGTEKNVSIAIPEDATITYTNNGQTEAGEYEVGYEVTRPNYETITGSVTLTVRKAYVQIDAERKTKAYGQADPALTAKVSGKPAEGAEVNYTLARTEGEDVGDYKVMVDAQTGSNPNYSLTLSDNVLKITPAVFEVEARDVTETYDGAIKSADIVVPEDAEITYTNNGQTEAGKYTVGYEVTRPNYRPIKGTVTLTIQKAFVDISAERKAKVFGQTDPVLTAKVNGKPAGGAELNYTLERTKGEDVGEYKVMLSAKASSNPNYILTTSDNVLEITPAAYEVEAADVTETYDGAEKKVDIAIPEDAAITYTNNGQTEAGEYEVGYEITRPNYQPITGTVTLTIEKANVTITPANNGKVYGTEEPTLTATDDKPENGVALNYTLARGEGEDVGTYPITVTQGLNPNYNVTTGEAAFEITPAVFEVEAADATETYDGTAKNVNIAIPEDAAITYTNNGQTEAGEYEVGYEITRPNYQPITGTVTLTIEKANVTITPANNGKVYGTEEPTLTATDDKPENGAALNYTLARGAGEDVGTYPITVTQGLNPNYNVTTGEAAFEITPAVFEVEAADVTETYDGTAKNVNIVIPENAAITYTNNGQTEAGEYEVGYKITRPNYQPITGTVTLTIEKANVTITPVGSGKVYDEADPVLTATDDKPENGAAVNYTLARGEGEDVGTYPITVTQGLNPNYNVTTGEAAFEITPAAFEVEAADLTVTYDGTAKNVNIAIPEDAAITYTNNGQTEAGEYEVGYEITRPNYRPITGTVTLTIEKANVTITPVGSGKVYDEADPVLTATDDKPENGAAVNYTLARGEGEDVGTYPITATIGENPNYNVTTVEAAFEITPAVFEVEAADMTETYDGTAKNVNIAIPEDAAITYTNNGQTEAGEYEVGYEITRPNYQPITGTVLLTIEQAAVTLTIGSAEKPFGAEDPAFEAQDDHPETGAALEYELTRAEGNEVGTYAITALLGENPNYQITLVDGSLTITPVLRVRYLYANGQEMSAERVFTEFRPGDSFAAVQPTAPAGYQVSSLLNYEMPRANLTVTFLFTPITTPGGGETPNPEAPGQVTGQDVVRTINIEDLAIPLGVGRVVSMTVGDRID